MTYRPAAGFAIGKNKNISFISNQNVHLDHPVDLFSLCKPLIINLKYVNSSF